MTPELTKAIEAATNEIVTDMDLNGTPYERIIAEIMTRHIEPALRPAPRQPTNNPHQRKCHDCGNVAEHADSITPWVLCTKCGSQDTRRIRT